MHVTKIMVTILLWQCIDIPHPLDLEYVWSQKLILLISIHKDTYHECSALNPTWERKKRAEQTSHLKHDWFKNKCPHKETSLQEYTQGYKNNITTDWHWYKLTQTVDNEWMFQMNKHIHT